MTQEEAILILGLPEDWTAALAKSHYRQFSQQHHPDKGGDAERFKQIKAAYELLTGKASPDNSRAALLERVQGLFMAAIEHCDDPRSYDLIGRIKSSLKGVKLDLQAHIQQTRRAINKREQVHKRLRARDPADRFLHGLLEKDIERHKRSLQSLLDELPKVDETLAYLDGYEYGTEDQPFVRGLGQINGYLT